MSGTVLILLLSNMLQALPRSLGDQTQSTIGSATTTDSYDGDGNLTLMIQGYGTAAAESTFYAYDANGDQTLQITGYGSSDPEDTTSLYDGDGNLTQQIDAEGNVSDYA